MKHGLEQFYALLTLTFCIGLLGSAAVSADVARLHAQLDAGEDWTMNLGGREGRLRLSGGKHHLRPGGNHLTVRDVSWKGRDGVLKVLSDNRGQSKLKMKFKARRRPREREGFTCSGFLSNAKSPIMAGSCDMDAATLPWFATRTSRGKTGTEPSVSKEKYLSCVRDRKTLEGRIADRTRQARAARKQLSACQRQLARGAGRRGSDLQSFDRIKDRIDAPYTASAPGAADGVISLRLPNAPASRSREGMWLGAVENKLLTAIHLGLKDDTARYRQAERVCQNIYCRLGLRANALLLMLGGTP